VTIEVLALDRDAGSVVLFRGVTETGRPVLFAAGHREAQQLVDALEAGELVRVDVEPWQVLG